MRPGDRFLGRFRPAAPPLAAELATWVGELVEWEAAWVLEASESREHRGEWACTPTSRWRDSQRRASLPSPPIDWVVPMSDLEIEGEPTTPPPRAEGPDQQTTQTTPFARA